MTDNDFLILLLGGSIFDYSEENKSRRRLGDVRKSSYDGEGGGGKKAAAQESANYAGFAANSDSALEENTNQVSMEQRVDTKSIPYGGALGGERLSSPGVARSRRRLSDNYSDEDYDDSVNVGADVFFTTVAAAALESSLPATVRVVSEGYFSTDDDNIELVVAREDMAGLFERNDVGDILRGALLSPALSVNTYYVAAVTNLSPLFKLPVDAVQRGRDHGLPTYNAAREASHSDARCYFGVMRLFGKNLNSWERFHVFPLSHADTSLGTAFSSHNTFSHFYRNLNVETQTHCSPLVQTLRRMVFQRRRTSRK